MVAAVPPSGSIEARAERLAESIARKAKGKDVNIIAYVIFRLVSGAFVFVLSFTGLVLLK